MLAAWRFNRALNALKNSEHSVVRDYAKAEWPERSLPAIDAPFLGLDFELDGLRKDADLLQAGWLAFEGPSIALKDAQSFDIKSKASLNDEAVTIHGIGEERAALGRRISDILPELIRALTGRVLVAHAARIEVSALQRATQAVFGADLPIRSVCTLTLEQRLKPNLHTKGAYRLGEARKRYGLPDYSAHDALTDAIAAAELLQAQVSHMRPAVTLGELEG